MKTRANSSTSKILASIILGLGTLFTINSFANNCSMQQIDQYLKKGFTHDQVVKLCTTAKPAPQQPAAPVSSNGDLYEGLSGKSPKTANPTPQTSTQPANNEDQLYFATVLDASPVIVSRDKLSYESKECAVYGDMDITQMRDKACIHSRVNIPFAGLTIISAQKSIPLIRDQELMIKGNITREYIDTGNLNQYQMQAVQEQLPLIVNQLDIPVKKGINPKDVATRLNRFIN